MTLANRSGKLNALGWFLVAVVLLALPVMLLAFLVVAAHIGVGSALLGFFMTGLLASWMGHLSREYRAARR